MLGPPRDARSRHGGLMQRRISYFDAEWSRRERSGRVRLAFDDRSFADLAPLSLEEMSLICNLLRAEKPVYYDEASDCLSTLRESQR
jgi:hypothetical protein